VLSVLYLIYNAGTGDLNEGTALRTEAIRLARALHSLLPNEPEAAGLLGLMLLNEARVPARTSQGSAALLRDQRRSDWNHELIEEGHRIVRRCVRLDRPGPFQLQAAIQAVHCDADIFTETDWHQVLTLYDHLYALMPTSIVALNRAIAISQVNGHDAALELLGAIDSDLADYAPFHAARAASLKPLGRTAEAVAAHRRAHDLATSARDREYHQHQLTALSLR